MEQAAAEHRKTLDEMPESPAGRIQGLQNYEFMDPDAHRLFWELMKGLQQQMLQPFLSNMQKALGNMTPQDLERMREMLRDLNRMLQDRAEGREPDFDAFKQKWGDHFPGAENLDQLIEQIAQQSGQMQSLLASMSPGQRRQLQDMMQSLFMQDERLEAELRQLGMNLGQLMPPPDGRRYNFRGDDDLTMKQAMELMDELRQLDDLERQIQKVRDPNDLEKIDPAAGRAAPGRGGQARPRAPARDDQEAGRGRLPRAQGRPARADRAGHPQDRRQGPARHLRPPQARPLRRPRARAARRGRRPHRPVQALRVRRPVPARAARDPDERGRAQRGRGSRCASSPTTSRWRAPRPRPRPPPCSCST